MLPYKKITIFLALTVLFSSISYVPIIRAGTLDVQGGLFVLTMMWSPGLSAVLTQLITTRSLRGLGWRIGSVRWLGLAFILPFVYALPAYAFTWLTGLGRFPNPTRIASLAEKYSSSNPGLTIAIFLLISLTVDMLGPLILALGEELGWRGLLVPELAKMTSFTKTALISGLIWAAWHLPAIFLADYNNRGTSNLYSAVSFSVLIVAISFPFAWLRLKSGSVWPAVILHAVHNQLIIGVLDKLTAKTDVTPYITGEFGIGLALTGVITAYIFWRKQRDASPRADSVQIQPIILPE